MSCLEKLDLVTQAIPHPSFYLSFVYLILDDNTYIEHMRMTSKMIKIAKMDPSAFYVCTEMLKLITIDISDTYLILFS